MSFEARYRVRSKIAQTIAGMILASIGIWVLFYRQEELEVTSYSNYGILLFWAPSWLLFCLISIMVIACVLMSLKTFTGIFDRHPVIVINKEGFINRRWRRKLIPWSAVKSCQILQFRRSKYIRIDLKKMSDFPADGFMKYYVMVNWPFSGGYITFMAVDLDCTFEDMLQAMRQYIDIRNYA